MERNSIPWMLDGKVHLAYMSGGYLNTRDLDSCETGFLVKAFSSHEA